MMIFSGNLIALHFFFRLMSFPFINYRMKIDIASSNFISILKETTLFLKGEKNILAHNCEDYYDNSINLILSPPPRKNSIDLTYQGGNVT